MYKSFGHNCDCFAGVMGLLKTIVPEQTMGTQTGASARRMCKSLAEAEQVFRASCTRLLDVNHWSAFSGALSAAFQLTDADGHPLSAGIATTGKLIRIRLPGPGNAAGEGYDWVRIEQIARKEDRVKDEEICAIVVKPVPHPEENAGAAAHFYTREASSTFVVWRAGRSLRAIEFGRNEKTNKHGGLLNRIRNMLVAFAARTGLSNPQWKSLMEGILKG
ncbi:MAG: hypothetical protein WC716_15165 [Chitinophagaceae bacterium]